MTKPIAVNPYDQLDPRIYAYTTPEIRRHDGWTKIGYTEKQSVEDRIRQQTKTADVTYHLEWERPAHFYKSSKYFTDHEFHDYLERRCHVKRGDRNEWFQISGNDALKFFEKFIKRDFNPTGAKKKSTYMLRREQEEAVEKTLAYFKSSAEPAEFLWNAKPRFGKTLSAYDLAIRMKAQKVLVVTNRPSIANSWYADYHQFIAWQKKYVFVTDNDSLSGEDVLSRKEWVDQLMQMDPSDAERMGVIAFESLQGLKGSVYFGGNIEKLKWIRDMKWDLLIVDEAHEGVDTYKTDRAFDKICRRFTLHLSGTPFKAIAGGKFRSDQIYNWSYADEQEAKASWKESGFNPYENLPELHMYTYQLSQMIIDEVNQGMMLEDGSQVDYAFDLNEFFRTDGNGRFIHLKEVKKFLHALTTQEKFPFSTPELRKELSHTFWLLDRVDSAKAMAKLLQKDEVFSNYAIVLAAGDGKLDDKEDAAANQKSYDKVMGAIQNHSQTITLSVGQLTTGVTVKPWTAVLMLSNMKSPAEYMQAAFRAQNPYRYEKDGKVYRKDNAYVFDFAPERTLEIFDQFANDLLSDSHSGSMTSEKRKHNVERLLNFFPVIGEDEEGHMVALDAAKVLTIPRSIKVNDVIRRGFMSNFLFMNIHNVFNAPQEVRDILKKLPRADQEELKKSPIDQADEVPVDDEGKPIVDEGTVINQTDAVFGPKIYGPAEETKPFIEFEKTPPKIKEPPEVSYAANVAEAAFGTLAPDLEKIAKDDYNLRPGKVKQIGRQAQKTIHESLRHVADDFTEKKKLIELEREKEKSRTASVQEKAQVEKESAEKMNAAREEFLHKMEEARQDAMKEAAQQIIHSCEEEKINVRKDEVEDDAREHLRGFTRTIPSFLMAYGDENIRLTNLEHYIRPEVFKEMLAIDFKEFCFLRDGGEYTDAKTGEQKHYDGYFDISVFDASMQEFLRRKEELADYFDESQNEDIFDYIPPQKTNQIFTPKAVVKHMVDDLEKEAPHIFEDPSKTFVDFYMKSGLYITEIVKRLYKNDYMKQAFPNDKERLKHILEHQVYGFAPTQIIYDIAMAYIFGFDKNTSDISRDHFIFEDTLPWVQKGKLQVLVDRHFQKK